MTSTLAHARKSSSARKTPTAHRLRTKTASIPTKTINAFAVFESEESTTPLFIVADMEDRHSLAMAQAYCRVHIRSNPGSTAIVRFATAAIEFGSVDPRPLPPAAK